MRKQAIFLVFLLFLFSGCQKDRIHRDYKDLDAGWKNDQSLVFDLPEINETDGSFNLFIYLRNDNAYLYSNIFIIASLEKEAQIIVQDTLEYAVAAADGSWLGKGFLNVKESKLWWKEAYQFPSSGDYTIRLDQVMRKNQVVEGIPNLDGIVSMGIELESIQETK